MPSFRSGTVIEVLVDRPGLQRCLVDGDTDPGRPSGPGGDGPERVYVLVDQVGPVAVGDQVVFNTTAVDLGLGTGGWHVVHWNLSRGDWSRPGPGHIMKQRYTSLQTDTGAAEEHRDPGRDLRGRPVVACTLLSQMAVVATVYRSLRPDDRIVYVMTDGAALPLALSDLVVTLRDAGLVDATVTAGHAFGGDREAVSMPSALAIAVDELDADVVIVAMGPGVVGTDSALGTTAVEAAWILDTAAVLGGTPILCVRASGADPRPRHRGASHHVDTVLSLTTNPVDVAVVADAIPALGHHRAIQPDPEPDVLAILSDQGLRVTSMGRGPEDDPLFYESAGAAGAVAARRRAERDG